MIRRDALILGPVVVGIAVHLWVLNLPLFSDDYFFLSVFLKPDFRTVDWSRLWEVVTCRQLLWPTDSPYYRPAGLALLMAQFPVWGAWSVGYHAFALLLFTGIVALLGSLIFRLSGSRAAAALGSLLFAIYPLHGEAVVWVSAGVFDVQAGFWLILAIWALARWVAGGTSGWAVVTVSAAGLAMLSKEAALLTPMMLTAALWLWPRPTPSPAWRSGLTGGAIWAVCLGILLYRARCFGVLRGTAVSYIDAGGLFTGLAKFVRFHLLPASSPWGMNWDTAAAMAVAGVTTLALFGRKGSRLTLWWGSFIILGALPALRVIGEPLSLPTDPGRVHLIPAIGISALLGHQLAAFPQRLRAILTGTLCAAYLTLSLSYTGYIRPLAHLTRNVLQDIEKAAGELGAGTIVVEGLPVASWMLAYACGPPFIAIPDSVRVKLSGPPLPEIPAVPEHIRRRLEPLPGGKITLRWNPVSGRLEPS